MASCGRDDLATHERIVDAQIQAMDDFTDVVGGMRKQADVEIARPEIEAIVRRMEEARAAAVKLGEPSAAEKRRLKEKLDLASSRLEQRMKEAAEALKHDPEAIMELVELMVEMTSKRAH